MRDDCGQSYSERYLWLRTNLRVSFGRRNYTERLGSHKSYSERILQLEELL